VLPRPEGSDRIYYANDRDAAARRRTEVPRRQTGASSPIRYVVGRRLQSADTVGHVIALEPLEGQRSIRSAPFDRAGDRGEIGPACAPQLALRNIWRTEGQLAGLARRRARRRAATKAAARALSVRLRSVMPAALTTPRVGNARQLVLLERSGCEDIRPLTAARITPRDLCRVVSPERQLA
jgi:hypothetical protein